MRSFPSLIGVLLLLGFLAPVISHARADSPPVKPLLMPGKTTLYQRVLTRPGAMLVAKPGAGSGQVVPPLTIFYVYGREKDAAGKEFVQVGANAAGLVRGWLAGDQTIEWKQSLVLSFANRAGRDRVLFFTDEKPMLDLAQADDAKAKIAAIRQEIAATGHTADGSVIAEEPDQYVDIRKQFYLLPILEAHEAMLGSGFRVNSVEVASVTAGGPPAVPVQTERVDTLKDFSAALVFVIDATASMGPYIDAAREVVADVYEKIEKAGLGDKMRFGLVGFRDDPKAVPHIEYLSRVFVDPNTAKDRASFMRQAASLTASKVSTRAFQEDGFAGLTTAIDKIDWDSFGGRYIVFITDASSREAGNPLSSTGLNAAQIREKALARGIAVYSVYLGTPAGASDRPTAEREYKQLSDYPNVGSLFYPIDAGSVALFRKNVDLLANSITGQVEAASHGQMAAGGKAALQAATAAAATPAQDLQRKTAELGYAMQLAYLGRKQATQAPELYDAWAIDRDLENPNAKSLEVRVLLTKNQLSDLQAALKTIVQTGIATETSRSQFFDQLRSAAATLSRDPTRVGRPGATNLKEMGLLGEYLDDLPYRSRVLALSEEDWNRWTIGEQVAFLDDLEAKIRLYQSFHDDTDAWVSLDKGASPGDAVYPVPLSALP
jgi:serine/threonine-protein kinase PpkA